MWTNFDLWTDFAILVIVFYLNIQTHAWRNRYSDSWWQGFVVGMTGGYWRPFMEFRHKRSAWRPFKGLRKSDDAAIF